MERQEIFNILQNFNLPKNKKDIITDLILNNKDNNDNNNTNTGNPNIIDLTDADFTNNEFYKNANIGYIYIKLYNGTNPTDKYLIKIGDITSYICKINDENNTYISYIGVHINGEEDMTQNQYNEEMIKLSFPTVNADEVNYVLNYLKQYNNYFIEDKGDRNSRYYISKIYGTLFSNTFDAPSVFTFNLGIGIIDNINILGINKNALLSYTPPYLIFNAVIPDNNDKNYIFKQLN